MIRRTALTVFLACLPLILLSGCRGKGNQEEDLLNSDDPAATAGIRPAWVRPISGTVEYYAPPPGDYVVVEFEAGILPKIGEELLVTREGAPIGKVRVTGPFEKHRGIADVIEGQAGMGDTITSPQASRAPGRGT